jgi:galactonate dehydratase
VRDGFDAVKVGVFDELPRSIECADDARAGIDCLRAVREAIGPDVDLLVDCHSHFTAAGALDVAEQLQDVGLFWFEEPIPQDDFDGYLQVMAGCGMPVAGGESRMHRRGWWDVLDRRALDIAMPDVTIVGGIGELSKVAGMAATRGIPTAPHGPFGPITTAASVHAMAAHPDFLILEYAWGEAPWRANLILPAETITNGRIAVSQAPGLGVELNPEMLSAHAVES